MTRLRITVGGLLAAAFVFAARDARAQGEDGEPPPVGPPRPPAPEPEEESPPLDATTPPPIPAPMLEPEEAPPPRFGAAGVVVITSGISIGASTTHYDSSDASATYLALSPGVDYFVLRHFSIGLDVTVAYSETRGYGADGSLVASTTTDLGVGPRFGLDVPLGRLVSFYPRLTVGIESVHREQHVVSGRSPSVSGNPFGIPSTTETGPWVALFTPLLIHPTRHLFLGAGPSLYHAFGRAQGGPEIGGEQTTFGGRFVLGAWWGGAPEGPARQTPPSSATHEPRFGDAQQLVLTGEASASVNSTVYAGSESTLTSVNLSPGLDYFVQSQTSLGLGVAFQYGKQTGRQPSGSTVTSEVTGMFVAPRIGVNIPIASWISFYPRATIGAGFRNFDQRSGSDQNLTKRTIAFASLYTPLLFHVASHAFFGVGPYVAHDLVSKVADGANSKENLATSVGGSVIVGGWL